MEFDFRLLTHQDLPLIVAWLAKPHVKKWWWEPEVTEKEFSDSIDGKEPTVVYIVVVEGRPIGIIQSYLVDDYPEHAQSMQLDKAVGIDLFIGEEDYVGKGYGSAMIAQFVERIIRHQYAGASYVVADPEVENAASIRAFEKAGFQKGRVVSGERAPEQLMLYHL